MKQNKPIKRRSTAKKRAGLKFVNLNSYTTPEIKESKNKDWVELGSNNNYFQYLIDLFNSSPTNGAAINGIAQMIYGRGLDATDSSLKPEEYAMMRKLFTDDCIRKLATDLKLFGQCAMQVLYNAEHTQIVQVEHYPVETLRPEKCNDEGEIEAYYYSADWTDLKQGEQPDRIPSFGTSNEAIEILYVKPYRAGYYYFAPVDYQSATQYADLESEIANFHLNNILNGMSPSLLLNFNSGIPDEDAQMEIERKIQQKYTGTSNSGKFILAFNNNAEEQATVEAIQLSDAHQQYQFLSEESAQKILIGHRITSPMLLGIKNNTGLGSNADELKTASILFDNTVIRPFQDLLINAFDSILAYNDVSLKLYFKTLQPLEFIDLENATTKEEVEEQTGQKLSKNTIDGRVVYETQEEAEKIAKELNCEGSHEHTIDGKTYFMPCEDHPVNLKDCGCVELKDKDDPCQAGYEQYGMKTKDGKQVPNCVEIKAAEELRNVVMEELLALEDEDLSDYELIDTRPANEYDDILNAGIDLASVLPSSPSKKSEQDTSILKIRYAYMGSNNPQRDFCKKMWAAKKIYRKEDLDKESTANSELAPSGSSSYNIWLYKGGVNCKHYWERRTYLRKNNKKITVTEAREKIAKIDPSLRSEARIPKNEPEVAQTAKKENNYWSLDPNYRR